MKKVIYMTPVAALILAILRFFTIKNAIELDTGFVSNRFPVIVFYILLVLISVLPMGLKYLMHTQESNRFHEYYHCKSPIYALSAAMAGIGFLSFSLGGYRNASAIHADTVYWQYLCVITAALAGISFIALIPAIFRKGSGYTAPISLLPVLFSVLFLLTTFLKYAALANVMDRLLDYAMLILTMLYFTCEARMRTGSGDYRNLYAYGLSASILILVTTLPRFMLKLVGITYFANFSVMSAAYLLLTPYILITVFLFTRRAGKKNTPKKNI